MHEWAAYLTRRVGRPVVDMTGLKGLYDFTLDWSPGDVFVVPSWTRYAHRAGDESVLFSISDRPVQEALGIWREGK